MLILDLECKSTRVKDNNQRGFSLERASASPAIFLYFVAIVSNTPIFLVTVYRRDWCSFLPQQNSFPSYDAAPSPSTSQQQNNPTAHFLLSISLLLSISIIITSTFCISTHQFSSPPTNNTPKAPITQSTYSTSFLQPIPLLHIPPRVNLPNTCIWPIARCSLG